MDKDTQHLYLLWTKTQSVLTCHGKGHGASLPVMDIGQGHLLLLPVIDMNMQHPCLSWIRTQSILTCHGQGHILSFPVMDMDTKYPYLS